MNIIDIVILVILGVNVLVGYFRGFIKTIFGLISMVLTIFLTYTFHPKVLELVKETAVRENLASKIREIFDFSGLVEHSLGKEAQTDFIANLNIPQMMKDYLIENNNAEVFRLMDVSSFEEYISNSITDAVLSVIVFIALFALISLGLTILVSVLDILSRLPILKQVNRIFGAITGGIIGIILTWILVIVVSVFASVNNTYELATVMDTSVLVNIFTQYNPFTAILEYVKVS